MKTLIINADDAGLSDAVNKAAVKGLTEGAVTGASIMSCGEYFPDACETFKRAGITSVGAHLTLTGQFRPVSSNPKQIKTLLSEAGTFPAGWPDLVKRYYAGRLNMVEAYIELYSQVRKIISSGLRVTHIDSHEHVHLLPGILKVAIKIAGDFDVPYIRIPRENIRMITKDFNARDLLRFLALKAMLPGAGRAVRREGIMCNDAFLGHFHAGRIDDEVLSFAVDGLAEGVNEMAVHPAITSQELLEASPWHKNAHVELDALLNGKWKDKLAEKGIKLATHEEVIAGNRER